MSQQSINESFTVQIFNCQNIETLVCFQLFTILSWPLSHEQLLHAGYEVLPGVAGEALQAGRPAGGKMEDEAGRRHAGSSHQRRSKAQKDVIYGKLHKNKTQIRGRNPADKTKVSIIKPFMSIISSRLKIPVLSVIL